MILKEILIIKIIYYFYDIIVPLQTLLKAFKLNTIVLNLR